MARFVSTAGRVTGVPGVRQNSVTREGGSVPGFLESGIVAILGTCEGTVQPTVVHTYNTAQKLKSELIRGDLYDAARFAFSPSRDDRTQVQGAKKILAVRVNPATRGTLNLTSAVPAALIGLTSRAYGISANSVSAQIAAGTSGGFGKKLTIRKHGENDEVRDDLGYNPVIAVRYYGAGTPATMTISRTHFTTAITGVAAENQNIDFATYDTITKLAAALNGYRNVGGAQVYEAVIVTAQPDTFKCEDLDFVTAADIESDGDNVTTTSATATTFDGSGALGVWAGANPLVNGMVIKMGSEYTYLTDAATRAIVRGFMDSTPATHTAAAALVFHGITGVNKAVIDYCNDFSQHVTAARNTAWNVGIPSLPSLQTYLSGGGEGATANSDWQNALDMLRAYRVNFIVVTSNDATVHGYLKAHLDWRWGAGESEALGHTGAATLETLAQLKVRARALQAPNVALWIDDTNRDNDEGVDTQYPPWAEAAMAAGIQAGTPFGEPLTYKSLAVSAVTRNTGIDPIDDANELIRYGLSFANFYDEEFRVVRCLSTWTNNDDDEKIEMNVRNSLAWTLYKVRDRIKFFHFGKRVKAGSANSIKSTVRTALEDIRDVDEAIVPGNKDVNGKKTPIPAFDNITVEQSGNVASVGYQCVPTGGLDFVNVNTLVGTFQDVA